MPPVIFRHPAADGSLEITTGADNFVWEYQLNLQTYSCYGGEVTQILSAMIGDITIGGSTATYGRLETIYKWFLTVVNAVTQGVRASSGPSGEAAGTSFAEPMTIEYPERGWSFKGFPKQLPGFKVNRDDAIATWQVVIAVSEGDQSVEQMVVNEAQMKAIANNFKYIDNFGKMSANVGFRFDNPFIAASGSTSYGDTFKPDGFKKMYEPLADFFTQNILKNYSEGNLHGLDINWASKPVKPKDPAPDAPPPADVAASQQTGGSPGDPLDHLHVQDLPSQPPPSSIPQAG